MAGFKQIDREGPRYTWRVGQLPYRGCVTTSMSAGSPLFTRAIPRRMAGPRSLGSLRGPSLYMPYVSAIFA